MVRVWRVCFGGVLQRLTRPPSAGAARGNRGGSNAADVAAPRATLPPKRNRRDAIDMTSYGVVAYLRREGGRGCVRACVHATTTGTLSPITTLATRLAFDANGWNGTRNSCEIMMTLCRYYHPRARTVHATKGYRIRSETASVEPGAPLYPNQ